MGYKTSSFILMQRTFKLVEPRHFFNLDNDSFGIYNDKTMSLNILVIFYTTIKPPFIPFHFLHFISLFSLCQKIIHISWSQGSWLILNVVLWRCGSTMIMVKNKVASKENTANSSGCMFRYSVLILSLLALSILVLPLVMPPLPPPPLLLLLVPVFIMLLLFFIAFSPSKKVPNKASFVSWCVIIKLYS